VADHKKPLEINSRETNSRILHFLQAAQYAEAEKLCAWLISTTGFNEFEPNFYLGAALQFQGKVPHALEVFRKTLALRTNDINVMQAIASCLDQLNRYQDSYNQLIQAWEAAPQDAIVNANLGAILEKLKKPKDALAYYDIALSIDPKNHTALLNRGALLANLDRKVEGLEHCHTAYKIHPQSIGTLFNLVDALLGLFRYEEALAYCELGLAWQPKHANLLFKKGLLLSCLKQFNLAHQCLAEAQVIDPKVVENILPMVAKLDAHVEVSLNPLTLYLDAMYQAQTKCFWLYRKEYVAEWKKAVVNPTANQLISNLEFGFQVVSLELDGEIRLKLSQNMSDWVQEIAWLAGVPPFKHHRVGQRRIKIGYLSADFRTHPVGLLSRQIYGLHDKEAFEIYGYSLLSPDVTDHVRESVEAGCDVFHDVSALTDPQLAQLIYQDEIDVLVDMTSYTTKGRPQVMAMRPAPVQVAYLGYPGTTGAEYMDYAIVDNVIAHQHTHWSEHLVTMPHAFSPYDNQTNNSPISKTRKDYQLPEEAIVFCCFNNNYKIEPQIFNCWMRILKAVPNSILWLIAGHNEVEARLKEAAQEQQVDPLRLIFAPFVAYDEHLARYQLADLFLDTHWHNAHTTAADALWQGLPVITCAGEVISSRLAASLLNALEMPELITNTFDDYEALAIYYATHHQAREAMHEKLKAKRYTAPLFDTARTTRNLEHAYKMMWQRYCDGLPPANMRVIETDEVAQAI
jgi:predicted O-linked N-acetylglucosamine transferase (SPINDLY family)